jgi:predicted aconitase
MKKHLFNDAGEMQLNDEEQSMLSGEKGQAVKELIEFQINVGNFFGANKFVPITNAHVMGDIEVMGDAGLFKLKDLLLNGAKCSVPTSSNARCMHFSADQALKPDANELNKEHEVIATLKKMNVANTDTCINYQTVYQPKFGEHVAWGDTGTVIYANSVFGARTNYEGGLSSFAASITGRTPAYGFHLDEHRRGTFSVEVTANLDDFSDWGALGKIVGHPNQDYFSVPVFSYSDRYPTSDSLKHLGASLASYGSMGMFHFIGATPEAPTVEAAYSDNTASKEIVVSNLDISKVYSAYKYLPGDKNIVVFSGPQLSLFEIQNLVKAFDGRRVAKNMTAVVTTNHAVYSDAKRLGFIDSLESSGVKILQGVCFYLLQRLTGIREENQWTNLISNSAKIVNTITAHRFNTVLRKTSICVEIACTGKLI